MKQINTLSNTTMNNTENNNNVNTNQMENLKKDYNLISDFIVQYKTLVDNLVNNKNSFFENILIDKSIGILKEKYPDIFDLLSSKEELESLYSVFETEKEILNKNILSKDTIINEKNKEIEELKQKLEKTIGDYKHLNLLYETKLSICNNLDSTKDSLEMLLNEEKLNLSSKEKEIKELNIKINQYLKLRDEMGNEISALNGIIQSIIVKNPQNFQYNLNNLNQENKKNLENLLKLYKIKW